MILVNYKQENNESREIWLSSPYLNQVTRVSITSNTGCFLFLFLFFLGPHLQHMKVPRLGAELEVQLPVYTTATATRDPSHISYLQHSSQQSHWVRPGIRPIGFVSAAPQQALPVIMWFFHTEI